MFVSIFLIINASLSIRTAQTLTLLLVVGAAVAIAIPEVHYNSTLAPTNTTSAPSNTTSEPISTTPKPTNATSPPSNTTTIAPSTTPKPTNATSPPSNTTTIAPSTTPKPTNATSPPSNTTTIAPSTTPKPTNATLPPSNTTTVAPSTTPKPTNATNAPSNTTSTTTAKPSNATSTIEDATKSSSFPHFQDVDPNTLSCDPEGHIFLLLPSFTDCSKFYMCAHGEEVAFSCAPGTIFDFVIQTCNHPWATECILRTPKEDSETEGSGFGSEPEAYGMFGEEVENGPIDFLTADSAGTVRPVAGNAGKLYKGALNCQRADSASRQVAYKGDCQRYWHCVGAVPQIAYCSDGLLFNELSQQCDFEANVKCLIQDDDELKGEFIIYN